MKPFICVCWISALSLLSCIGLTQNSFGDFIDCKKVGDLLPPTCADCNEPPEGTTLLYQCLSTNPPLVERCNVDTTEDGWQCEEYEGDCPGDYMISANLAECLEGSSSRKTVGGCDDNPGILTYTMAADDSNAGTNCNGIWIF